MSMCSLSRAPVLLVALFLALNSVLQAEEGLEKRLTGTWLETKFETKNKQERTADNLITFAPGGDLKLHLKKGEKGDLRSLDGKWTLETGGGLKIEINVDGATNVQNSQLSFEGEEMILTDGDGRRTWHTRHEGPLPERFHW